MHLSIFFIFYINFSHFSLFFHRWGWKIFKKRKKKGQRKRRDLESFRKRILSTWLVHKLRRCTSYAITFVMGQHSAPTSWQFAVITVLVIHCRIASSTKTHLLMERSEKDKLRQKNYNFWSNSFNIFFLVFLFVFFNKNDKITIRLAVGRLWIFSLIENSKMKI